MLTFPRRVRFALARDAALCTKVIAIWLRALDGFDGRFRYRMKRTVRGKDELVLTGLELVEKLAVLIPPPRIHLVRFHGVVAPTTVCSTVAKRFR